MLTKKNYIKIINAISKTPFKSKEQIVILCNNLIEYFKTDNINFDEKKFKDYFYKHVGWRL